MAGGDWIEDGIQLATKVNNGYLSGLALDVPSVGGSSIFIGFAKKCIK
jgi:hypothetical protein